MVGLLSRGPLSGAWRPTNGPFKSTADTGAPFGFRLVHISSLNFGVVELSALQPILSIDRYTRDYDVEQIYRDNRYAYKLICVLFSPSTYSIPLQFIDLSEIGVSQIVSCFRLNMIHEGTNGIQSLDLRGRKARCSASYAKRY